MNPNSSFILGLALVIALIGALLVRLTPRLRMAFAIAFGLNLKSLANDGALTVGEHEGAAITMFCDDAPYSTRFQLVRQSQLANVGGAGDNHCQLVQSVLDLPIAVCYDQPLLATDPINTIGLLGGDKTLKMQANGAIPAGQFVVSDGTGKVRLVPQVAGLYWCVGVSRTTSVNSGDLLEVMPTLFPLGVDVIT